MNNFLRFLGFIALGLVLGAYIAIGDWWDDRKSSNTDGEGVK